MHIPRPLKDNNSGLGSGTSCEGLDAQKAVAEARQKRQQNKRVVSHGGVLNARLARNIDKTLKEKAEQKPLKSINAYAKRHVRVIRGKKLGSPDGSMVTAGPKLLNELLRWYKERWDYESDFFRARQRRP